MIGSLISNAVDDAAVHAETRRKRERAGCIATIREELAFELMNQELESVVREMGTRVIEQFHSTRLCPFGQGFVATMEQHRSLSRNQWIGIVYRARGVAWFAARDAYVAKFSDDQVLKIVCRSFRHAMMCEITDRLSCARVA